MECPNCGLLNPEDAIRCDCGYYFGVGKLDKSSNLKGIGGWLALLIFRFWMAALSGILVLPRSRMLGSLIICSATSIAILLGKKKRLGVTLAKIYFVLECILWVLFTILAIMEGEDVVMIWKYAGYALGCIIFLAYLYRSRRVQNTYA